MARAQDRVGPGEPALTSPSAVEQLGAHFGRAAAAVGGSVDRWYTLAGATLCIRFAGSALAEALGSGLAHLASAPVERPDLTLYAWDTGSTGVAIPARPSIDRREGFLHVVYQPEPESLSVLAPGEGRGAHWVPDVGKLTSHERAAPFRPLLHWWQRDRGRQLVHGAAVGTDAGAVLLAGASGSGKSTAALACLLHGIDFLGDDYVLLEAAGEASVHCVYSVAKLNPDHLGSVPSLVPLIANPDRLGVEKALWLLHAHRPERIRRQLALRAVLVPRVEPGAACRIERISAAAALLALAPSTIVQLRGQSDAALAWMARFVTPLPCYRLCIGRDLEAIAAAVRAVLERC